LESLIFLERIVKVPIQLLADLSAIQIDHDDEKPTAQHHAMIVPE